MFSVNGKRKLRYYHFIQTFKKLDGVEVHPIFLHILMDFE